MSCPRTSVLVAALVLSSASARTQAQTATDTTHAVRTLGAPSEDRRRIAQMLGARDPSGNLIRVASSDADTSATSWMRPRFQWVPPSLSLTWNSRIPSTLNDGAMWAGRGLTFAAAGGVAAQIWRLHIVVAPEVWHTENRSFPMVPSDNPSYSNFASPFQMGTRSADTPIRFGYRPITTFDLGESAVWVSIAGVAAGVSNEAQWWGPGIRNALTMSNNAGGIPHAFLRTAAPVHIRIGTLEARWMIGELSESRFFDYDANNDLRSLSAAVATFSPRFEPALTVGIAKAVYANVLGTDALPPRTFDVFLRWLEPQHDSVPGFPLSDTLPFHPGIAEQVGSVFARYVLPASAAEVYGEWGRIRLPSGVRSFLVAPQSTQGFTVGLQWAPEISPGTRLRLQAEATNLEQSPPSREAGTLSFYTNRLVPQGYTQRGQMIGAAIGPGSSSQWLAADWLRGDRSVGVFGERIRWNTDAYYQLPIAQIESADVSVVYGMRGDGRLLGRRVASEIRVEYRYNYLFQNADFGFSTGGIFNQRNATLRLRIY